MNKTGLAHKITDSPSSSNTSGAVPESCRLISLMTYNS